MLSNKEIVCPNNLLDIAHKKKGVKVAIVNAGKPLPMLAALDAVNKESFDSSDESKLYQYEFDFNSSNCTN